MRPPQPPSLLRLIPAAGAALLWSSGLAAQSITSGSVSGWVRHARTGQPLTQATLTLRNPENGWVRTARTDDSGQFRFQPVPVGTYQLSCIAPGMVGRRLQGLAVGPGGSRDRVVPMEEAAASAVVDVVGAASEVDVLPTGPLTRFLPETLGALPQATQNLGSLLLLAPGATPTDSGHVSVDGARATQNQFLVDGMSVTSAYYGLPMGTLSSSFLFSMGMVQEVQILSQAFDVQLGEAAGAVINTLTRSGTNQFRGQCLFRERPAALAARMRPVASDPRGIQNRPENLVRRSSSRIQNVVLSGPLVQDRVHFLLGVERTATRDLHLPTPSLQDLDGWRTADLESWNRVLGDRLLVGPGRTWSQDASEPYPSSGASEVAYLRLDARLNPSHALALRATTSDWTQPQGWGSTYTGASHATPMRDLSHSVGLELQSLMGPDTFHELRLQRVVDRFEMEAGPDPFPELVVASLGSGQSAYAPERYSERLLQLSDVWNLSRGRWTWKAGADLKAVDCRDDALPYRGGSFLFPNYRAAQGWVTGSPSPTSEEIGFSQSFRLEEDTDRIRTTIRSAFLQCQRQDAGLPDLTLQLGLRGTWQTWDGPVRANPQLAGADTPQGSRSLDPRASFLWSRGPWTLRGGTGRFSSPNLGALGLGVRTWNGVVSGLFEYAAPATDPLFSTGVLSPAARLSGHRLRALEPGQIQDLLRSRGSHTLYLWDPDDRMAQCWKSALELVWEPDTRTLLKVRATTSRTRNLAHWVNINLAQCDADGKPVPGAIYRDGYPTRMDRFSHRMEDRPGRAVLRGREVQFGRAGDVFLSTRGGRASNRSLVVEFSRKADLGFSGFGSLTLAEARDLNTHEHDLSIGPRSALTHPADPDADEAPSDYDQPLRLVGMLQYATAWGLRLSLTGRLASGRPFTALDFVDLNGDGLRNDASRHLGGRNGQRFPGTRTLDLVCAQRVGLGSRVKAEGSLEISNVLNEAFPRSTHPYATYQGQPIPGYNEPSLPDRNTRSLRLGLLLSW